MIPFEQPLADANRFFGAGMQGQRQEHFVLVPRAAGGLRAIGRFLANANATAERKPGARRDSDIVSRR